MSTSPLLPNSVVSSSRERNKAPSPKLTFWRSVSYGIGNIAGTTLGYGIGGTLVTPVYMLVLGVNPILLGLALAIPRLIDLVTDPLAGYLSDALRHRFSRQVFVAAGSLVGALCFAMVWLYPAHLSEYGYFAWLLTFTSIALIGWSFLSVPLQALGYEMTDDPDQRTKLMATASFMGQMAALVYSWGYSATQLSFFHGTANGARWVGGILALLILVAGWVCAVFCRSQGPDPRSLATPKAGSVHGWKDFLAATRRALRSRPFLAIAISNIALNLGMCGSGGVVFCVLVFYVCGGSQAQASVLTGASSVTWLITGMLCTAPFLWLSRRFAKRRVTMISLVALFAGTLLRWRCNDPAHPWLFVVPYIFFGAGMTGFGILTQAMTADICDLEKAKTGAWDGGIYSAFYSWTIKLGTSLGSGLGGVLLVLTGYDTSSKIAPSSQIIFRMRVTDILTFSCCVLVAILLFWSSLSSRTESR